MALDGFSWACFMFSSLQGMLFSSKDSEVIKNVFGALFEGPLLCVRACVCVIPYHVVPACVITSEHQAARRHLI